MLSPFLKFEDTFCFVLTNGNKYVFVSINNPSDTTHKYIGAFLKLHCFQLQL